MITSKERLLNIINGYKVDRVPCMCPGGMMNMIVAELMDVEKVSWPEAHNDSTLMATLASGTCKNGILDNVGVPFCMTVEAEAMGAKVYLGDKYTEPRVIEYPTQTVSDFNELSNMDFSKGRSKVVLEALTKLKNMNMDTVIVGNLTGPVSLASSLVDASNYYKDLRRKPSEVHKLMNMVTENLISFGKEQLKSGADIIAISDPSGTGEILGPKLFRKFALPYLNRIVNELNPLCNNGVIVHICGKLKPILKELNDLDNHILSFDSITSIKEVKENVPNKVLMGNISTLALDIGVKDSLKSACKFCIDSGVGILSPACGLGTNTKIDSIKTLIEVSKENSNDID
ncbi:uroporphyrinogen decarboxylase family protein [Clostridium sp.]|uniref:uroporphyrinogen decarboxylase family protein n=1 Tax=Clostridium sp. TaxID=1506 RepID=UPI003217369C